MPAENPFWDFSLAVYRRPGVAAACLRLQEGAAADVNLLLYCCWAAAVREDALDRATIQDAVARTQGWQDGVVAPLRAVRRRMKQGLAGSPAESVETLHAEVKRVELESERFQQDLLYGILGAAPKTAGGPGARRRAEKNITAYLAVIGAPQSPQMNRDCRVLSDASFPDERLYDTACDNL